jgi:hypothetical protein
MILLYKGQVEIELINSERKKITCCLEWGEENNFKGALENCMGINTFYIFTVMVIIGG